MRPATMTAEDLALLKAELEREDLQIYSVVVMARRDLEVGKVDAALARLRVDADKLLRHAKYSGPREPLTRREWFDRRCKP